jgi:hypothetical protein
MDDERKNRAGKAKAKLTLEDHGVGKAWDVYTAERPVGEFGPLSLPYEEATIRDMVGKLVKYGSLSEKQHNFIRVLLNKIEKRAEIAAQRAAAHEAAEPAPVTDQRIEITGKVVSLREPDDYAAFPSWKMLVVTDQGWKAWGSRPSSLYDVKVGDRVTFKATFKVSDKDPKFGFFNRPTQAEVLEKQRDSEEGDTRTTPACMGE